MKESDAKTKWCPMARVVIDATGYGSGNRFGSAKIHNDNCLCIGSACMMWETLRAHPDLDKAQGIEDDGMCGLVSGRI